MKQALDLIPKEDEKPTIDKFDMSLGADFLMNYVHAYYEKIDSGGVVKSKKEARIYPKLVEDMKDVSL